MDRNIKWKHNGITMTGKHLNQVGIQHPQQSYATQAPRRYKGDKIDRSQPTNQSQCQFAIWVFGVSLWLFLFCFGFLGFLLVLGEVHLVLFWCFFKQEWCFPLFWFIVFWFFLFGFGFLSFGLCLILGLAEWILFICPGDGPVSVFFFGTSPYCRNLLERLGFKSYVKVETPGHGRGYQLLLWRLAFKSIMSLVLWLHQYMTHLNVFKVAELPGLISCWCFSFITMRRVFFQQMNIRSPSLPQIQFLRAIVFCCC